MDFSCGLAIIVRDGVKTLPRLLNVIGNAFNQVVVVDTGSTDGTVEMLEGYQSNAYAKIDNLEIHKFKWVDDFSAARNFAQSKLTTSTWMWLDADDTCTQETITAWIHLAKALHEKKDTHGYQVPYWYVVDHNNNPLIVHYRERIMKNPQDWVWKEPLHEVCCHKFDAEVKWETIWNFPVIHKPEGRPKHYYNRNATIIEKDLLSNPEHSIRTVFYMVSESVSKQPNIAIVLGKSALEREDCVGYYRTDIVRYVAEAYHKLGMHEQAEIYFRDCVAQTNANNAHKVAYLNFLVDQDRTNDALRLADSLAVEVPQVHEPIDVSLYGGFKQAFIASVYIQNMGDVVAAIEHQLKAMEFKNPHELFFENDRRIRAMLEDDNAIVMYADKDMQNSALGVLNLLHRSGQYKTIILSDSPMIGAYARKVYYHFSNLINTCYKADIHHTVDKYLVSDLGQIPLGWQDCYPLPTSKEEARDVIGGHFETLAIIADSDSTMHVCDLLDAAKATRKPLVLLATNPGDLVDKGGLQTLADDVFGYSSDDFDYSKVTLWVTPASTGRQDLIAIAGSTEKVNELMAIGPVLHIPYGINDLVIVEDAEGRKGVECLVIEHRRQGKRIVFVAPGLEEWDGTTPYKYGIGASESSVIYLATELALLDHDVMVYCPTTKGALISGVRYQPLTKFCPTKRSKIDVLISSRMPDVLKTRIAPKQILWLHDLPSPIDDSEYEIDNYVYVSNFQRGKAIETCGHPRAKAITLRNGIYTNKPYKNMERVLDRSVWISSPDRGLENLLAIDDLSGRCQDLWVLYGFSNYNLKNGDNYEGLRDMHNLKRELRYRGAKLAGRVPIGHVKQFLQTVDYWAYPTEFEETFCVSALECSNAGVYCIVGRPGATLNTLKTYVKDSIFARKELGWSLDATVWEEAINNRTPPTQNRYSDVRFVADWRFIVNDWQKKLIAEAK